MTAQQTAAIVVMAAEERERSVPRKKEKRMNATSKNATVTNLVLPLPRPPFWNGFAFARVNGILMELHVALDVTRNACEQQPEILERFLSGEGKPAGTNSICRDR